MAELFTGAVDEGTADEDMRACLAVLRPTSVADIAATPGACWS
jgi:hypothetical protein